MSRPMVQMMKPSDWKLLEHDILEPGRFNQRLTTRLGKATRVNLLIVQREVRENIKTGKYGPKKPNSDLTIKIKGSSKPLVDSGQLFQAITHVQHSPFAGEIGVARSSTSANIAKIVHDGAVIPVTPKMRAMFAALAAVSKGQMDTSKLTGRAAVLYARRRAKKQWKPLKAGTTKIVIPARPFIAEVMESTSLQNLLRENWLTAASAAVANTQPKLLTGF